MVLSTVSGFPVVLTNSELSGPARTFTCVRCVNVVVCAWIPTACASRRRACAYRTTKPWSLPGVHRGDRGRGRIEESRRNAGSEPAIGQPHGRRHRSDDAGGVQLGPMGQGRSARHDQPDHSRQAEGSGGPGESRPLRLVVAQSVDREDGRQHGSARADLQSAPARLSGRARYVESRPSRVHVLPPRRALPLVLQGQDVQRLRRVGSHGAGLRQERHRADEGGNPDARGLDRYSPPEKGALPRARHAHPARGPRSLGEDGARQDFVR